MLRLMIGAGVATLTLSQELLRELREALREVAVDPAVKVVVLSGEGDAFSAGGDLGAMYAVDAGDAVAVRSGHLPEWDTPAGRADRVIRNCESPLLLHEMPKPTIARIRGPAVGAALSLALACDLRYIDRSARFITGFGRVGLPGDLGIAWFLQSLVGPAKARELMLLGEPMNADAIMALGLANAMVDDATALDALVGDVAQRLARGPTLAYRGIKQDLRVAATATLRDAMAIEAQNSALCLYSDDAAEAQRAFNEKRPAVFTGR